ncbi:hypothetical protein AB1K84_21855 [Mesobacillus foraminis]
MNPMKTKTKLEQERKGLHWPDEDQKYTKSKREKVFISPMMTKTKLE